MIEIITMWAHVFVIALVILFFAIELIASNRSITTINKVLFLVLVAMFMRTLYKIISGTYQSIIYQNINITSILVIVIIIMFFIYKKELALNLKETIKIIKKKFG